jgi:carbon monoxide dehydrogenase subunit G
MDMTGEYRIPAPRQRVWEALNDAEVLKASIPGCDELIKRSDTELEAKVTAKVGPVSAKFGGAVTLGDLNPPQSYTISGQGSGGAAGFAKGGANVVLTEDGSDTILRYEAKAEVGGKLAQIGSRLIQGTAKKMADEFFGKFSTIVAERAAAEAVVAAAEPTAPAPIPPVEPVAMPPLEPVAPAPPSGAAAAPSPRPAAPTAPTWQPPPPARGGLVQSPFVWLGGVILLLLLLFWIFS